MLELPTDILSLNIGTSGNEKLSPDLHLKLLVLRWQTAGDRRKKELFAIGDFPASF
jgi:hypothetical protein